MKNSDPKPFSYEEAFQRLEQILTSLNEGNVSLDRSLKLFEEANQLIETCSKQLNTAEKRIEMLIKNRDQKLQIDADGHPKTQEFSPPHSANLNTETGELVE